MDDVGLLVYGVGTLGPPIVFFIIATLSGVATKAFFRGDQLPPMGNTTKNLRRRKS
jgi:hypothetical protein